MKITDAGHEATEEVLEEIQRRIEGVYAEATIDVQEKLNDYLAKFAKRDAEKLALVEAGKMSQEEYAKWRYGQICTGQRWRDMADVLARDYTNADKIAMSVVRGHLPEVYAINANYGTYQLEHSLGINTGWTLYDRHTVERLIREQHDLLPKPRVEIPEDMRWNKQHIVGEVTQGVLQGEPIPKIADRLQRVTDMDRNAAMRNARTAVTGAQNAGRIGSYRRAVDMGIRGKKQWLAVHDGRTRASHEALDGEQVEIDELFSNGLEYPGDPSGGPAEVYNCRCTLVWASAALGQVRDEPNYKPSEYDEYLAEYRQDKRITKMSFAQWTRERKK